MSRFCKLWMLGIVILSPGMVFGQTKDPFEGFDKPQPPAKQPVVDPFAEANKLQQPGQTQVPVGKQIDTGLGKVNSSGMFLPQNQNRVPGPLDNFDINVPGFKKGAVGTPKVKPTEIDIRIDLYVDVAPRKVKRGELVTLTVRGVLRPGFHTYPMTKRADSDAQLPSQLAKFIYQSIPGLQPLAPIREMGETEFDNVKNVGWYLVYNKEFTWKQDLLVLPDSKPGIRTLEIAIDLVVCDSSCIPGKPTYKFELDVSEDPAVGLTPEIKERLNQTQAAPTVVPLPGAIAQGNNDKPAIGVVAGGGDDSVPGPEVKRQTLVGMILLSMVAALAMLCTPCVFPMIPITVSICLKQSQKENHNALLTAAVYSLTIIIMLTASILLLGGLVVALANNVWLNLALGLLMVYFALSLFGMYEIELPRGLARFTNSREDQGGYAGIVFMALTFTITSFTCTGPFLGPLLVAAKETKLSFGEQFISSLAYSTTFAAPFFVLALFPSLAKKLPKSGGWLNSVKVVMGFIEFGLAFKFLSNSDLAFNPGRPVLFNYETVLCGWIGLSIACGFYLLGIFRLPHDSPVDHLSVPRMLLAGLFLSFAIYITPALWRVVPQGVVGNGIVAFLPLDTRARPGDEGWLSDYALAYKEASENGKLIFVDFTGVNCPNCRYNEKNVFVLPEVQQELKKYVRVQLYTDSVPNPKLSAAEAMRQGDKNSELRANTFNDGSNPLYAIIRPGKQGGPFVEQDGLVKFSGADPKRVRKGLIPEAAVPDFLEFLRKPLQNVARGGDEKDGVKVAGR